MVFVFIFVDNRKHYDDFGCLFRRGAFRLEACSLRSDAVAIDSLDPNFGNIGSVT